MQLTSCNITFTPPNAALPKFGRSVVPLVMAAAASAALLQL